MNEIPVCTACGARHTRFESCGATGQSPPLGAMPPPESAHEIGMTAGEIDRHHAIMDACRMLLDRLPISKCELAQELRTCADILENEILRTDPPLNDVAKVRRTKER